MLGDPARTASSPPCSAVSTAGGHPDRGRDPSDGLAVRSRALAAVGRAARDERRRRRTSRRDGETGFRARVVAALVAELANPGTVTGLEIAAGKRRRRHISGSAHFEAIADDAARRVDRQGAARSRARTRRARRHDSSPKSLPDEGQYPGVDVERDRGARRRADRRFRDAEDGARWQRRPMRTRSSSALAAIDDFLPSRSWPPKCSPSMPPAPIPRSATRERRRRSTRVMRLTRRPARRAERAGRASGRIRPRRRTVSAFSARSIGSSCCSAKTSRSCRTSASDRTRRVQRIARASRTSSRVNDPWQVTGWMPQLARVREGSTRFAAALSAHEALVDLSRSRRFQASSSIRIARDRCGRRCPKRGAEPEGVAPDPKDAPPEELHDYLAAQPGRAVQGTFSAPRRTWRSRCHARGASTRSPPTRRSRRLLVRRMGRVHSRSVPDRRHRLPLRRTGRASAAEHPPGAAAAARSGELDVRRRARRAARSAAIWRRCAPCGRAISKAVSASLLPGNYLPQSYTDDLPSVQLLKMQRDAMERLFNER